VGIVRITGLTFNGMHGIGDDTFILFGDRDGGFKIGEYYEITRSDPSLPITTRGAYDKEKVPIGNYRKISFFGRIGHVTKIIKGKGTAMIVQEGLSAKDSAYSYFAPATKCVSLTPEETSNRVTTSVEHGKNIIAGELKVGDFIIYHRSNPMDPEIKPKAPKDYDHIYWYPLSDEGDGYLPLYMFLKKYCPETATNIRFDLNKVLNKISPDPNNLWRHVAQKLFNPAFTSELIESRYKGVGAVAVGTEADQEELPNLELEYDFDSAEEADPDLPPPAAARRGAEEEEEEQWIRVN
jgi:hypothetical protein